VFMHSVDAARVFYSYNWALERMQGRQMNSCGPHFTADE